MSTLNGTLASWAVGLLFAVAFTWFFPDSVRSFSFVWFWRYRQQQQQQQPSQPRTEQDLALDAESRRKAREAALERQKRHDTRVQQRRQQARAQKLASFPKQPQETATTTATLSCRPTNPIAAVISFPLPLVAEHDGIRFYHMSHLAGAPQAAAMMQQIAQEFMPIIRRRGYFIWTVSEMCCCGDGLDTGELGGQRRRLAARVRINGMEQCDIYGYNRTSHQGGNGGCRATLFGNNRTRHSIHLRLRHPQHHDVLRRYADVAQTMCHELAHCVHYKGHTPEFFQLEAEIQQEYASLWQSGGH